MKGATKCWFGIAAWFLVSASQAHAGMTVYDLSDVVRLRLEDISFFALLLVVAALGVQLLWNFLIKDFPKLPRLSFLKALSLTVLISIAMLLVLAMISGAREIFTPGAWYRQGSHYRPNEAGNIETRQQSLESLRAELMHYADAHKGQFPPHDYVSEIPTKVWQAPDTSGTRYLIRQRANARAIKCRRRMRTQELWRRAAGSVRERQNSVTKNPRDLSPDGILASPMKRLGCAAIFPGAVLLFLILMIAPHIIFPPFLLLFGWIPSLLRLTDAWRPRPVSVLLTAGGLISLVVGTQFFMRWLVDNFQKSADGVSSFPTRWRLKWTICGFGIVSCALLAMASFVLSTHQIYWISRSSEPWFLNVTGRHLTFAYATQTLQKSAETNRWNLAETRAAFWKMESIRDDAPAWETLGSIWIPNESNSIRAILVLPRQSLPQQSLHFAVLQPDRPITMHHSEKLPMVLASLRTNGPGLSPLPP